MICYIIETVLYFVMSGFILFHKIYFCCSFQVYFSNEIYLFLPKVPFII